MNFLRRGLASSLALLLFGAANAPLAAQGLDTLDVGSEAEREAWAFRLLGDAAPSVGVGRARQAPAIAVRTMWNPSLPSSVEAGHVWAGRGLSSSLAPRIAFGWKSFQLQLAPELWYTENRALRLIPADGGALTLRDPMRPAAIDLPQRLGVGPVARLEPGQTTLQWQAYGARVALTSAPRRLGVGASHSLLMSPDAPGFPRLELGSAGFFRTPLGRVSFTLAAGQLAQTAVAPDRRAGSRSGAFLEGRWQPLGDARLELGAVRFSHADWRGARGIDLMRPVGSLFFDAQRFGGGAADNELLSVFGALRVPTAGLELWAEFGLNDRQADVRGLVVELEHNSAWLFGLRRAWQGRDAALWSFEATGASARIPPIEAFRPQATFYEHIPLSQGHTQRGQLLGTRLLERTGGAELRLDRFDARGRVGLVLGTRDLAQSRVLTVPEERLRREWSAMLEASRLGRAGLEYGLRVGALADLNRFGADVDAYAMVIGTGVTWRWAR